MTDELERKRDLAEHLRSLCEADLLKLATRPDATLEIIDLAIDRMPEIDDPECIPKLKAIVEKIEQFLFPSRIPGPSLN